VWRSPAMLGVMDPGGAETHEGGAVTRSDQLAGRAMRFCAAWYGALVVAYLLIAFAMPDPPPDPECYGFGCGISLRDVMLYGGVALVPVVLFSLFISTLIVVWRSRRGGREFRIGTLAAFGGLSIGVAAACVVVTIDLRM